MIKKISIKETKVLNEAELKFSETVKQGVLQDAQSLYKVIVNPRYVRPFEGNEFLMKHIDLSQFFDEKTVGALNVKWFSVPLREFVYVNNKEIKNGVGLFYAMNCLTPSYAQSEQWKNSIAKYFDVNTKQFSDDFIEQALDFEYKIPVSYQSLSGGSAAGAVAEQKLPGSSKYHETMLICMLDLAAKDIGIPNIYQVVPYQEFISEINLTLEHELRHITQLINEKCVRYGNELKKNNWDLKKVPVIPKINATYPVVKTTKAIVDPATKQLVPDLFSYNPDYKVGGKEKHERENTNVVGAAVMEFFGQGKDKLDLKPANMAILNKIGWTRDEIFKRYLKSDVEYHQWTGDLMHAIVQGIGELAKANPDFAKILNKGEYNKLVINSINNIENNGFLKDFIKNKQNGDLEMFYETAKAFRKRAFFGDLIRDLEPRLKSAFPAAAPSPNSLQARLAANKKKNITEARKYLKDITKYRTMSRKFREWSEK